MKAEEHVQACVFNKIDNRKARRFLYDTNSDIKKVEREIASKNIPRDRKYERVQIIRRLQAKLEKKKSQ